MKKYLVVFICIINILVFCCACGGSSNTINLDDDAYNLTDTDYKTLCEEILYKDFRNEATFIEEHKKIKCTGEVVQICVEEDVDSNYYSQYRINITKNDYGYGISSYTDDIYVYYLLGKNPKLLEGDIVTLYGEAMESVTYTTVNNATRTIPAMVAVYVDIEE